MKKYLFGTLCMSALLASCTNDELALTPQENGEGEKIEVKLAASYPDYVDEANTRMALVGKEWAWINGDMLGACKVAAIDGTAANIVTSNYPFMLTEELTEPTKNVSFKTNTAVFAGQYVFYHQYNGDLIGGATSAQDLFNVTFPAVQTVDPANPVEHVAKENIWVSPVIKLGGIKYNKENETAIKFVGLNAVLKLNIKNSSKEGDLIINKVDVNGDKFPEEGNLDFATSASFPVTTASDNDYADKLDAAIETMNAADVDLLASSGATKDGTKISAVITGNGISLKKDAETAVYVLIPAGEYDINSAASGSVAIKSFTVYTNKGKFEIDAEDARKGDGKGQTTTGTAFNRNSLLNLYPVLEDNATPVDKYDITGLDDWNNAVAYALANLNSKIEFNLLADITISEFPACPLYVTSAANKLILAADKTFTLHKDSYFATIENKGTLNLVDNSHIEKLINKGTVNVAASEKVAGIATQTYTSWVTSATNGIFTLENQGTIVLNGQMTAITTWSNTAAVQDVSTLGTIQVNKGGNFIIGAVTVNKGKIVNNGAITLNEILTNSGTIEVATAAGTIVSDATPKTITNTGKITLDAPKDIFVKADGKANDNSYITAGGSSTGTVEVAITPAGVSTLPEMQEVNCVKMSGAWNAELVGKMNAKWSNITNQIWDGVTLDVAEIGTKFASVEAITINGASAINNSGDAVDLGLPATAAASEIIVNGDLTIAKKVTIGKGATDNLTHSPVITVLGSVTNNGEVYAGLTVGAAAVPGVAPANTSAIFTNAKDAKVTVASAYASSGSIYTYGDLSLYGTFVNNAVKANVEVREVKFLVQGKSTFTGEYTPKTN